MQNIVLVCGHNQTINRKPHAFGNIAREDVPKVACWHGKADLAMWRAELNRR